MLSYRHAFHAGNHADVLKHIVLSLCLEYLKQKEKPVWIRTPAPVHIRC
jgi:23S rRNA (adenine2030-N6)-methyltransferase